MSVDDSKLIESNISSKIENPEPKTGDIVLFFPYWSKMNIFRFMIVMFTCSKCDHIAIVYRNVPEKILETKLKTKRSLSNTYVLEYDKPDGLNVFAYESYIDAEGDYYRYTLRSSLNSNDEISLDTISEKSCFEELSPKIKLDNYLLSIYNMPFAHSLNLLKGLLGINKKDDTRDIYCAQFVTELLQYANVVSSNVIANDILPKHYYNNRIKLNPLFSYPERYKMV
jgi:hypothetical protein